MHLELRSDKQYHFVILMQDEEIRSAWDLDQDSFRNFCDRFVGGDADDWDDQKAVGCTFGSPDAYGELVASRDRGTVHLTIYDWDCFAGIYENMTFEG